MNINRPITNNDKLTVCLDHHSSKDSPTESSKTMVNSLQKALHGRSELSISVVRDEAAAGSPDCSMSDALQKLKW